MAVSAPRAAPLVAVLARGIEGRMTMSDNPSAFPFAAEYGHPAACGGMTLRDAFALAIAGGMAAHSGTMGTGYGPGDIADRSYEIADAMLAARTGDA